MDIRYIWGRLFKKLHGRSISNSNVHKTAKIGAGSLVADTIVNRYSYCGYDCKLINCEIGSFVSISDRVVAGGASHPLQWASLSPVFYTGGTAVKKKFSRHGYRENNPQGKVIIGSDVWVGSDVLIKAGVTVGDGAAVGMGSVVVKDVPRYAIVAGNPAKVIRMRFDEYTVKELEKSRWWELPDDEIEGLAQHIPDVAAFIRQINNGSKAELS